MDLRILACITALVCTAQAPHHVQKDAEVWQKGPGNTDIKCIPHDKSYSTVHIEKPNPGESSAEKISSVEDYTVECTIQYDKVRIYYNADILSKHPITKREMNAEVGAFIAGTAQDVIELFEQRMREQGQQGQAKKKGKQ